MREKWVTKKASELKQGDTLATGAIVDKVVTDRKTDGLGYVYRTRITVAGGDYLDTQADRELEVIEKPKPKLPVFRYTLSELMLFNTFTMAATTIIVLWIQHQWWMAH